MDIAKQIDLQTEYKSIIEQDKDKTYLDILPKEFKTFKRSIIKHEILFYLNKTETILNEVDFYRNRKFDKKDVVRYMMFYSDNKFELSYKFIPPIDFPFAERDKYREIERSLNFLKQSWDSFLARQKISKGQVVQSFDIEKDGYPRTGRGAMCYLFTPIEGNYPTNLKDTFKLYNPRSKKDVTFKILGTKNEGSIFIYKCENEKGKIVFLSPYDEIEGAYDCLFPINKETYSGWWNRTLISKEI